MYKSTIYKYSLKKIKVKVNKYLSLVLIASSNKNEKKTYTYGSLRSKWNVCLQKVLVSNVVIYCHILPYKLQ